MSPAIKGIVALVGAAALGVGGYMLLKRSGSERPPVRTVADTERTKTTPGVGTSPNTSANTGARPTPTIEGPRPAKDRFTNESRDVSWAKEVEERLAVVAEAVAVPGARVSSIDCRASVCRLEVIGDPAPTVNLVEALGESKLRKEADTFTLSRNAESTSIFLTYVR